MIHTKRISEMIRYFFIIVYMILAFYIVLDVSGSFGFAAFFIVPPKSYSVIPLLILAFLIPITLATVPLTVMINNLHKRQILLYMVITYGFICYIESVISNVIDYRDYLEIILPVILFLLTQFVILLFLQKLWKKLGQNRSCLVLIFSVVFLFSLWGYLWIEYDFNIKEMVVFRIIKFLEIITGL